LVFTYTAHKKANWFSIFFLYKYKAACVCDNNNNNKTAKQTKNPLRNQIKSAPVEKVPILQLKSQITKVIRKEEEKPK